MRRLILFIILSLASATVCLGQVAAPPTQVYRGAIGRQAVVVKLQRAGDKLAGSYVYERVGQAIKLTGQVDAQGQVTLAEFDAMGRQTGKFTGKFGNEESSEDFALAGTWTRADGSHETSFSLTEQHIAFAQTKLQISSKTITERRLNLSATYLQLSGLSTGASAFNRAVASFVTKMAAEFKADASPGDHMALEIDYNVLFANDALISVELTNYTDYGGAHPNNAFDALNYDLRTGRPIALAALFKRGANYEPILQRATLVNLLAQMKRLAGENGEPPDDTLFAGNDLAERRAWGLTPRGLVIYLDLPHVISVFDKVFIPWAEVQDIIEPQGPAAQFVQAKRK